MGTKRDRRIRVVPVKRQQPDLKLLARVLIELAIAEENRAAEEAKPKPGGSSRKGRAA